MRTRRLTLTGRRRKLLAAAGASLLALAVGVIGLGSTSASAASGTVTFAAGGDWGANTNTARVLQKLDTLGTDFTLALGDFDYDQTPSDAAWCDFVHNNMPTSGPTYPFELLVGNHEDDGLRDGYILNFTQCLPDRLSAHVGPGSVYGAEYYLDYPAADPMVRSILLAPGLSVEGVDYSYTTGVHRQWLIDSINSARAAGIPWVVVGSHYPCVSMATLTCGMTKPLMRLLVQMKVDLILQGHNHIYERSKQLTTGAGCTDFSIDTYDADCVADSGADDAYTKGAGSVVLTLGASGMTLGSTKSDDPQVNYFAASSSNTYGITKFTATPTSLNADFVPASGGTFSDSFSITGDGGGGGGGGDDTTPPAVTNRSPAPGATGVLRGRNVTATFSEPVTGVNGTTMTLRRTSTGALISAAVSYDPTTRVATLDPTNRLPSSTQFTVTLTSGITDTAGNPLPTTTWTFTTAS